MADNKYIELDNGYNCNGIIIEKSIVRDTSTPRNIRYKRKEKIIFPYKYNNDNELLHFTEDEFQYLFPGAFEHLMQFKDRLDKRKSDVSSKWFEYGRSQALSNLNRKKLLISTIITRNIEVSLLDKDCMPYAGMYIIPRKDNIEYSLADAMNILKSDLFYNYVKIVGIPISGNSIRITSKDIENYYF